MIRIRWLESILAECESVTEDQERELGPVEEQDITDRVLATLDPGLRKLYCVIKQREREFQRCFSAIEGLDRDEYREECKKTAHLGVDLGVLEALFLRSFWHEFYEPMEDEKSGINIRKNWVVVWNEFRSDTINKFLDARTREGLRYCILHFGGVDEIWEDSESSLH